MGTSVKRAVLLCAECFANIYDTKTLVQGSDDPNDVRCPECGSGLFHCGLCRQPASKFALDGNKLTWDCKEGCNP